MPYKCAMQATHFLLLLKQCTPEFKNNRKGIKKKISIAIYGTVVTTLQVLLMSLMDFIHMHVTLKRKLDHLNIHCFTFP